MIARVDKIWNPSYNRLVKQHGMRVSLHIESSLPVGDGHDNVRSFVFTVVLYRYGADSASG